MSAVARDESADPERDRIAWNLPQPRPKRAAATTPVLASDRDDSIGREATPDRDEAAT